MTKIELETYLNIHKVHVFIQWVVTIVQRNGSYNFLEGDLTTTGTYDEGKIYNPIYKGWVRVTM